MAWENADGYIQGQDSHLVADGPEFVPMPLSEKANFMKFNWFIQRVAHWPYKLSQPPEWESQTKSGELSHQEVIEYSWLDLK